MHTAQDSQHFSIFVGQHRRFDPAVNLVAPADMIELDRWAVARANQLQAEIVEAYQTYQFHQIFQSIHNFCVNEMGGFYLDIIKDRQIYHSA